MKSNRWRLVRVLISGAVLVPLVVLEYAPVPSWCHYLQLGLALAAFLFVGYDILLSTVRYLASGNYFNEKILMTIACFGAFGIGEFPEAVAVMTFAQLGEYLEKRVVESSRKSIKALLAINPDVAHVVGEDDPVPCADIPVGSMILVKAGERIPLDGVIVEGESDLDLSALNGESLPKAVCVGSDVQSGAINLSGTIVLSTTKPYGESTASKMIRLIQEARQNKAPVENFVAKFAKYFTPIVVGCAILVALIPPLCIDMGSWATWSSWIKKALVFLVVSCPCAIVISVPLGYFGAIGSCSKLGILVKGGYVFSKLSTLQTVALDKTGTVTKGSFEVAEVKGGDDVVYYAAVAEQNSNHPIARSVMTYYQDNFSLPLLPCVSSKEQRGKGVVVQTANAQISVGNAAMMTQQGIDVQACDHIGTVLHVAKDQTYLGYIVIQDMVKQDSRDAIAALKENCHILMLSGDNAAVVESVAHSVGIDDYRAAMTPEDKVTAVKDLSRQGAIAFVGDGINDAPVLASADVGFAMGGIGQDAAIESCDVVLTNDSLWGVVKAQKIAVKTQRVVKQNILFALGVKFGVMALGLTPFSTNPAMMWLAVVADVGVSALCIFNALRTTRIEKKKAKKES